MTNQATTTTVPRLKAIRHHKQRFDPAAEFIWRKRLRMGDDPEQPFVHAGDRVDKEALRPGRLKRFWVAGVIELADWTPPGKRRPSANASICVTRASRSLYILDLMDSGGEVHGYRCHGLGNLLLRADNLSIRPRVEALLSIIKQEEATAAAEEGFDLAEPSDPSDPSEPSTSEDDSEDGDTPPIAGEGQGDGEDEESVTTEDTEGGSTEDDAQDSSTEVESGEGDAAPDGGTAERENSGPADSPSMPPVASADEEKLADPEE